MDEAGDGVDVDELRDDIVLFCYSEVWKVVWWCGG